MELKASGVLVDGRATGKTLLLTKPISLWGGVDPNDGRICDPRHPQCGELLAGRILVLERIVGSSSGSSIMLEVLSKGVGPAGLVLSEPDSIAVLGVVVSKHMGYGEIPVVLLPFDSFPSLGTDIEIEGETVRTW